MEFRQLEVFSAVAEQKSFSRAAEKLFLTQSTVSAHIKNLEHELGRQLIVRTTKSIRLTEDGRRLLKYADRMIETRSAAIEDISGPAGQLLHIGASTIPSACLLPELICAYRSRRPNTAFEIRQGDSREICEMLLDGRVDIGFTGAAADSSSCVNIPFFRDEIVLVMPGEEKYRAYTLPQDMAELVKNEQFIFRESGSGTQSAAEQYLAGLGAELSELNVAVRTNDTASIKEMIARGLGVTVCSRLVVRDMERLGQVVTAGFPGGGEREFYICCLRDREIRPMLREFMDFAAGFYKR